MAAGSLTIARAFSSASANLLKPLRADGRKDIILVAEVAVGRHRRNADFNRKLAHRDRVGPVLGKQPGRDLTQPFTKTVDLSITEEFRGI